MAPVPHDITDDPALLKQLLAQLLADRKVDKGYVVDLGEQIKLLGRLIDKWRNSTKPQGCCGQCADLQPGQDCEGQRPRALYVTTPRD